MKRAVLWAAFGVALLAAIFTLIATVAGLAEAVSGHLHPGDTLGSTIAAVVILVVVTAALVWAAWVAEHHARRVGAAAQASPLEHPGWAPRASTPASTPVEGRYEGPVRSHQQPASYEPDIARPSPEPDLGGKPTPRWGAMTRRSRRRHTPTSHISTGVIFGVFALISAIGSVAIFHDWRQSLATQNNGVRLQAAVVTTSEVSHSTRSGSYYTTNLTVQYPQPIGGRTQGVIAARQDEPQIGVANVVAVVVDRSDPTHVELQGVPGTNGSEFFLILGMTVLFGLLSAVAIWAYRRSRARASNAH